MPAQEHVSTVLFQPSFCVVRTLKDAPNILGAQLGKRALVNMAIEGATLQRRLEPPLILKGANALLELVAEHRDSEPGLGFAAECRVGRPSYSSGLTTRSVVLERRKEELQVDVGALLGQAGALVGDEFAKSVRESRSRSLPILGPAWVRSDKVY